MATYDLLNSQSGPRITVNDLVNDPHRVPAIILDALDQGFLAPAVLRDGGSSSATDLTSYEESTPLYLNQEIPDRAEGGEIPVVTGVRGELKFVRAKQKAARAVITQEQRDFNRINELTATLTQVINTFKFTYDKLFFDAVAAAPGHTVACTNQWDTGTGTPRLDILAAAKLISQSADAQGARYGFRADTLLVNDTTSYDLIASEDFNEVYASGGNIADEHLLYTGKLPQKIMTYDVLESPLVPAGTAYLMMRNRCGFIRDTWPLRALPLVEDPNRLSWSSRVIRMSAIGIDNPMAICKLTNVG